jgi:hypothetical protein
MPSFLVTKRMSPELAARVMKSVSGRAPGRAGGRLKPLTALLRLSAIAFVATLFFSVLYVKQKRAEELEQRRATLLAAARKHAASLTRTDFELAGRVEAALALQAVPAYAGDLFAAPLRSREGLDAALAQPMIYLRGPLDALGNPTRIAAIASNSWPDALVLCLLDPPAERSEKALKARARAVMGSRAGSERLGHVERFDSVLQVIPLLQPAWQKRVEVADSANLRSYEKLFEVAPLARAVRAAKARQLLAVMDEPGDAKAPAELDGERPHDIRVTLTDLVSGEVLLRYRRTVNPSWISAPVRAEYAGGIDSCGLALDLRAAATGQAALAGRP